MITVSIIMPSLNVAPYIRECMDSVLNQSLKDIEIICVDAGSSDGTLDILKQYEKSDSRVRVIVSDRKSYGYQMNLGTDAAKGEYIGIVETDDFIDPGMYEKLFGVAFKTSCDIVKADYDTFTNTRNERFYLRRNLRNDSGLYDKVIAPVNDRSILDASMYNWAGIYKKEFLDKYKIRYQETPGASFQDNGFFAQVFTLAESVFFIHESFYRYRMDNPESSINNPNKVFCMCDEYDFAEAAIRKYPDKWDAFYKRFLRRRYKACEWSLRRIAPKYKEDLCRRMHDDFKRYIQDPDDSYSHVGDKRIADDISLLLSDQEAYLEKELERINGCIHNIERLCRRINGFPSVVIFGAGEQGSRLGELLFENGIMVSAFGDNNLAKQGTNINRISVVSAEKAVAEYPDGFYIIAMGRHVKEVKNQLIALGISSDQIYVYQYWRYIWD